jgi:hypothetical protein
MNRPEMDSDLARLVDAVPGLVWTGFPDGQFDFVNRRWCDFTGLGVDESCGRGWQAVVHVEDLPRLLADWQSVQAATAPIETQARLRGADGTYRWFLFRAQPSADAAGRIVKLCGLSTDIDAKVRAEDALRASERRSQALLAGEKRLLEMVASGRPMRDILTSLCRLVESIASGCSCSIVLLGPGGTELQEAIAPSLPAEFNDAVRGWPLSRVGGPCVMAARDNTQVIMADVASDTRWRNGWRALAQTHGLVSCWSTPIVSLAGKVLGTFALYQRAPGRPNPLQLDLIEQFTHIASIAIEGAQRDAALDKVRSELAHVTRAMSLGALTASIAHEVNQPLAGIVTNASACLRMLAADPPNLEGARETVRRTIRDGNRAGDVITRLRALFNKEAAPAESFDLNEATREVLSLVSNDLWRNRVVLRLELDDEPLLVIGDRVQLQQVILNLVRNASDAMRDVHDRARHLLVRAEKEDGRGARLVVKDSGVGLDPQTAERLFEAFYTTKHDGMGIGLSVSRSIIENHGGKLYAEANGDQGATFSFSLPAFAHPPLDERPGAPLRR